MRMLRMTGPDHPDRPVHNSKLPSAESAKRSFVADAERSASSGPLIRPIRIPSSSVVPRSGPGPLRGLN
jgi:hypothetical protein